MQRTITGSVAVLVAALLILACGPVDSNVGGNNYNANQNVNYNTNQNTTWPDASVEDLVRVYGTIWSPGSDKADVSEKNRFPIPGAAVIAYSGPPAEIPQVAYCNECVEYTAGTPNTIADPVTGEFELLLMPGRDYHLTIQKGEFRRVRLFSVPNAPGTEYEISFVPGGPRPVETTLPNRTDLANGDNVPKIAMIKGSYEDMEPMFTALGFDYTNAGVDFDIFCVADPFFNTCPTDSDPVADLLNDAARLAEYNLIIVSCGADWENGGTAEANLRQWVKDGGSLYVDDFNYDFVEQPWPEFLSWYVDTPEDGMGGTGPCGDTSNPSDGWGNCNNWSSYDFAGNTGDATEFGAWLALAEVNQGAPLVLQAAWDYLFQMGPGEVGRSETGQGPNGEVYMEPKVWMWNTENVPFGSPPVPATVSWPFYCGKVLYTVYHTHSGSGGANYELLLQEKIMMYLIMEVQTCSTGPVVD